MPRRKKLTNNQNVLQQNINLDSEPQPQPKPEKNNHYYDDIIKQQDDEYEIAVIMDLIKIQEQKDKEICQQNIKIKQEMLELRNHHIKEILRKIKISNNLYNPVELSIIQIFDSLMDTENFEIVINDNILYTNIYSYLGLGDAKATIRLSHATKDFVRNTILLIP